MPLSIQDLIALAALIATVAIAFIAHRTSEKTAAESNRSNQAMLAENRRIAQSNEDLVAENQRLADANQDLVNESRRMANAFEEQVELTRAMERTASKKAERDEAETIRQAGERERANTARFVFEPGRQDSHGILMHLRNRGPHVAENASAIVMWEDQQVGGSADHEQVAPDDNVQVAMQAGRLHRHLADPGLDRTFAVILTYDDGNGHQEKQWIIHYGVGDQLHSWRSEVVFGPEF